MGGEQYWSDLLYAATMGEHGQLSAADYEAALSIPYFEFFRVLRARKKHLDAVTERLKK